MAGAATVTFLNGLTRPALHELWKSLVNSDTEIVWILHGARAFSGAKSQ